jgi:molybdopterin converting factor small subunit
MPVTVRIPTPLRAIAKGNANVEAKGGTIGDVIGDLESQFPGLRSVWSMRAASCVASSTST